MLPHLFVYYFFSSLSVGRTPPQSNEPFPAPPEDGEYENGPLVVMKLMALKRGRVACLQKLLLLV